jgi:hypothetical protein
MAITYTEHAKSRMRHRGITKLDVEGVISRPYFVVPLRLGRFVAVQRHGDKYLKVVCERRNDKIRLLQFIGRGDRDSGWCGLNTTRKPMPCTFG